MKQLLIIANMPSPNTQRLANSALVAAQHDDLESIKCDLIAPLDCTVDRALEADALLLGTTENLASMSGAMKDFFDRCYYPLLDVKQGMPIAAYIKAGQDGTGTKRQLESFVTGLRWRWVQEPLVLRGPFEEAFVAQVEELALGLAAGLDAGVF